MQNIVHGNGGSDQRKINQRIRQEKRITFLKVFVWIIFAILLSSIVGNLIIN